MTEYWYGIVQHDQEGQAGGKREEVLAYISKMYKLALRQKWQTELLKVSG